jgi:hypothetical protein
MQQELQTRMGDGLTVEKRCDEPSIFEVTYEVLKDGKTESHLVCEEHWNRQDEKGIKYFQVGVQSKRKI